MLDQLKIDLQQTKPKPPKKRKAPNSAPAAESGDITGPDDGQEDGDDQARRPQEVKRLCIADLRALFEN